MLASATDLDYLRTRVFPATAATGPIHVSAGQRHPGFDGWGYSERAGSPANAPAWPVAVDAGGDLGVLRNAVFEGAFGRRKISAMINALAAAPTVAGIFRGLSGFRVSGFSDDFAKLYGVPGATQIIEDGAIEAQVPVGTKAHSDVFTMCAVLGDILFQRLVIRRTEVGNTKGGKNNIFRFVRNKPGQHTPAMVGRGLVTIKDVAVWSDGEAALPVKQRLLSFLIQAQRVKGEYDFQVFIDDCFWPDSQLKPGHLVYPKSSPGMIVWGPNNRDIITDKRIAPPPGTIAG